jgi:hypothetical protein
VLVGLAGRDGIIGVVVASRSPCRHGRPREERDDRRGRPVSESERGRAGTDEREWATRADGARVAGPSRGSRRSRPKVQFFFPKM